MLVAPYQSQTAKRSRTVTTQRPPKHVAADKLPHMRSHTLDRSQWEAVTTLPTKTSVKSNLVSGTIESPIRGDKMSYDTRTRDVIRWAKDVHTRSIKKHDTKQYYTPRQP